MKHHVITRTYAPALVALLLCCVSTITTGQDNNASRNQPTKALPAQSTTVDLDGTDPDKLILEVRPLIKHVHPGDPLRIAMHLRTPTGPVSRDTSLTHDIRKTLSHLTVRVTKYAFNPQMYSLDARIEDQQKQSSQQKKKLHRNATWLLHIHNDGFKSTQGMSGTWTTDTDLDVTEPGRYGLKLEGQLVIGGKKVPFATKEIRYFSVIKKHGETTSLRKIAQETVETTFPEKNIKEHDQRASSGSSFPTSLVFEDRSGRLVFHVRTEREQRWSYTLMRAHVSPEEKQVKTLWTRHVNTCIAKGTPISTPAGPVAIEALEEGDVIWGYDVTKQERVRTRVQHIRSRAVDRTLRLGTQLRITPNHPIYVNGEWKPAGYTEEQNRNRILRASGASEHVQQANPVNERVRVYDLSVQDPHTYFAGDILVHNKMRTWSPTLDDPWYVYWQPENPNWNAVDLPQTSAEDDAEDGQKNADQNGTTCQEMIQKAKEHAKGKICTSQVQELVCPHDDGHLYTARNGCEISYLKNRGWSEK